MSDTRSMIADGIDRLLAETVDRQAIDAAERGEWPLKLWEALSESGFSKILVDDGDTTGGERWTNAYPVFHAIGMHCAPVPLAETVVANGLLSDAGLAPHEGPMAIIQHDAQNSTLQLAWQGDQLCINGSAQGVAWAQSADAFVISGMVDGHQVLAMVDARARGVSFTRGKTIAGEPIDTVSFNSTVSASSTLNDGLVREPVTLYGALARAAMLVGAAESALRLSIQYVGERKQFGRPIGSFQAIQQMLAALAGEVTAAQTVTRAAFESARPAPSRFSVAVAKVRAGQAASMAASIAHQVHGAIGFSQEYPLQLRSRRIWSWRADFGSEAMWAQWLGNEALRYGGASFWPRLTAAQAAQTTQSAP